MDTIIRTKVKDLLVSEPGKEVLAKGWVFYDTPEKALFGMLQDRGTEDCLYVAGSLYLIAQLKEWLKELAND